jgi:hypothetical protein
MHVALTAAVRASAVCATIALAACASSARAAIATTTAHRENGLQRDVARENGLQRDVASKAKRVDGDVKPHIVMVCSDDLGFNDGKLSQKR